MTDVYAVMGNPINHTKSPQIHSEFAEQTQQDIVYSATLVPIDGFEHAVRDFFKGRGKGLNITVPFKEQAFKLADQLSPRALKAMAVNTLMLLPDGKILGDNTDGAGLVNDLTCNLNLELAGKRILIIGAGGAVRGILQPFLEQQPLSISICNRTYEKASELAASFKDLGNVNAMRFEELSEPFDLIINGTSASLSKELPPVPPAIIGQHTWVYDMMYGKEPTVFLQWAKSLGAAQCIDGLGMLVGQAAVSYELWRSIRPDTKIVLEKMRQALQDH